MIGTGSKSIDYKNSVCTFPDRKSSKGMCENLVDFLTNAHRKFQLSKFSRFSVHREGPLQVAVANISIDRRNLLDNRFCSRLKSRCNEDTLCINVELGIN